MHSTGVDAATIIYAVLLLLAVLAVFAGIKAVPQGQVWMMERFRAFTRPL